MATPSFKGPVLLLLAAAIVLVVALVPWGDDASDATAGAGAAAGYRFPVTVVDARAGRVIETVELVGDVATQRWAELAFERTGRIAEVLADVGDEITEGTLLARLDDSVLERQIEVARAAAAGADLQAELARREAERANEVGDDILSASERDQSNVAAATAEQRKNRELADVRRLEALLEQGHLRAPFDAVIARRFVTDGSHAALGRVAFAVADLERREVVLEIPAHVAAGLPAGAPVTLTTDPIPELSIEARLDLLVPAADPTTRNFRAIVRLTGLDPDRQLLPGMFVRASFVRRQVDADVVVPVDAVQGPPDGPWIVAAVGDEGDLRARVVPVRVLARNADEAAVEPIEPGVVSTGATVVVTGAGNVFPEAPLRAVSHGGSPATGTSGTP